MTEQLDLALSVRPPSDDLEERRLQLVDALRGRGWITGRRLHALMPGWGSQDGFLRLIRSIAEDSEGRIVTGQRGYALIEETTAEERYHAGQWLIAQGRKMTRRGIATIRRAKLIDLATQA
jgi:hypothetical protein